MPASNVTSRHMHSRPVSLECTVLGCLVVLSSAPFGANAKPVLRKDPTSVSYMRPNLGNVSHTLISQCCKRSRDLAVATAWQTSHHVRPNTLTAL